jgi:eukaryotic-like serine/threonine-protein kinase
MQLTHLGPYVIDKPLGKGGMGSVYAATDTQTGQRVAIKALTPHLAAAEGFRERFEAEIESLKTLRHEGIVRLYGYGEQDGVLFYSMELIEGISLEDELKAGRRFNWREVTNIAIQLSLALKHAHDHGIVHRDIKPANILLAGDEHVKLADFGIARLFGTTSLTTAGGVLGTADYMSPEQADGRPVTARCDQYSLGGVMYALLAGRPPFRAKNLPQMLQMQRFANPEPVRRYAPDAPEQLEHVISQLLAKDPAQRFPNTQILARHLQALVNALSRPASDDFALAADLPPVAKQLANVPESLSAELTQAEIAPGQRRDNRSATAVPDRTLHPQASQNAATLAAEQATAQEGLAASAPSLTANAPPLVKLPEPTRRFTTVEEEELRLQALNKRSWIVVAAQLGGLVAVLLSLGAFAVYLSRPPSADKLYALISSRVDNDDDASLVKVENEVADFLNRFPNDPRADTLRSYRERIELDKLERKLQRQMRSRGVANVALLPAEELYLQAINAAPTSPEKSLVMFESLVDLYGAEAAHAPTEGGSASAQSDKRADRDATDRTNAAVQLARRRIEKMRAELDQQHAAKLAALNERLGAAERLAATNREQAIAMYRAIVALHQDDSWANAAVEKARGQLVALEKK